MQIKTERHLNKIANKLDKRIMTLPRVKTQFRLNNCPHVFCQDNWRQIKTQKAASEDLKGCLEEKIRGSGGLEETEDERKRKHKVGEKKKLQCDRVRSSNI